jgi:predicted anti-sigma-YlaC factor YlaD
MTMSCDMCMDLLPLYEDGLASEDSARAVRRHLASCPHCREMRRQQAVWKRRTTPVSVTVAPNEEGYRALSKRLHKRHAISTAAILGIVALSVAGTLYSAWRLYKK